MKKSILLLVFFFASLGNLIHAQPANWVWARQANVGASVDQLITLSAAINGYIYMTGHFNGSSITFGSSTLSGADSATNFFLVKYDVNGNVIWARSASANNKRKIILSLGITADNSGNAYATGFFTDSALTFGAYTLHGSPYENNYFIVKYDAAGNVAWAKTVQGFFYSKSICTDGNGNVYVAGYYASNFLTVVGGDTLQGNVGDFLVKYDPQGNVKWVRTDRTTNVSGDCNGRAPVATDANGNVYMGGYAMDSVLIFGTDTIYSLTAVPSPFLVKYDSSGNVQWAQALPGSAPGFLFLSVTASGNAYYAGRFDSTIMIANHLLRGAGAINYFLAKFDSAGHLSWAQNLPPFAQAEGVATDANGNAYVAGEYTVTTVFGADTLPGDLSFRSFIAKYDASGAVRWAKGLHGPNNSGNNLATGLGLDNNNDVYLSGSFSNSLLFAGSDTLHTLTGLTNTYIAKISQCLQAVAPIISRPGADTLATGTYASYQWLRNGTPVGNGNASTYKVSQDGNYQVIVRDTSGCTDTSAVYQVLGLGIAEAAVSDFRLYPNPANGIFILETQKSLGIEFGIYDITGNLVWRQTIRADKELIDLSQKEQGIYFLHLQSASEFYNTKLVIAR